MAKVVSDIILSPARVWYGAVGVTLPADTVAAGASWGAGWTELGYTAAPLTVEYNAETVEADIQESLSAVHRWLTKEEARFETLLAEFDLTQLNLAFDGTLSTTAPGVGQPGKEEITVGGRRALSQKCWGFEGTYVDEDGATFPIRFFIYKATAEIGGSLTFGKSATTGVALKIRALADLTKSAGGQLFKIQKILEPAT